MPHIDIGNDMPGITGLIRYRPETGIPLMAFADALLSGENTLTRGEREVLAAHVSTLNECQFCAASHTEIAAALLPGGKQFVEQACADPRHPDVPPKLAALLDIAGSVQKSGRSVTAEQVVAAREAGATDLEVHDTVLIAAMFCMVNRYVDGLGTALPYDAGHYAAGAERIAEHGYVPMLAGGPSKS